LRSDRNVNLFPAKHGGYETVEMTCIINQNERQKAIGDEEKSISFNLEEAYQKSYDNAIAHFIDSLESGEPFETDRLDNLETLQLVSEAYRLAGL
jgi:hypothetical protein